MVRFEQRCEGSEELVCGYLRKRVPSTGNRPCKGPKVGSAWSGKIPVDRME